MCILFLYTNPNPGPDGYRLIIATNRDEILKRPATEIDVWKEDIEIIGGRCSLKILFNVILRFTLL